ncbi:MAG: O-antigen ligase family protein [Acidobacteria bacterium]|nr:O-antigen ligase family protein [Acidobacteriota bacterium]
MPLITFIPGIICVIVLLRSRTQDAFLNVVLPVLLLIPVDYYITIRPIPPLNMIDAVLIPLGIAMFIRDLPRWRFSRTDIWLLIYIFSFAYADYKAGQTTAAVLRWFIVLVTGLVPYMAGKLLIEQNGIRAETAKRFITLLFVASAFGLYEYVGKSNPYQYFWSHFYPGQWSGWHTQIRWGFGRVAGPYAQSELAGMIVLTGLVFALWLGYRRYRYRDTVTATSKPFKYAKIIAFLLFVTLGTTQARGPWIGTIIALPVAWIGLARFPKRRALLVFIVGLAIGIPAYLAAKDYASGKRTDYGSERETAQYRAQLIDYYIPIAQLGGPWGWGALGFPRVNGQLSIDNEYLFVYLAQGYVGLTSFILLLAETAFALLREGLRTRSIRDRHFIFSLLGVVLALSFVISTVFLGAQSFELFFLIVGWSQSIRAIRRTSAAVETRVEEVATAPALMRVYT